MNVMKEKLYIVMGSLETEGPAYHAGPHGEAPGLVRRQGEGGEGVDRAFIMISSGKVR